MVDYVGGLVQSISCEMVDQSQVVMNTNSHPSTMHVSQCLGDQCTIDLDCHANADIKLHCSQKQSMTCQQARYMYEGDECEEDHQCREGYCTGVNGLMKCMPKRSENSICSISAECTSGTKCCDMAGGARCSRDLCSPMSDITECMNIGGACYDSAACCNGSCLFERSVIEGQCM
ncbi:hypothetical protein N7488_000764 [Penicillium malachiteum]|nr:hypothetical protein N7488_000764 [Penicillium malachiteum]